MTTLGGADDAALQAEIAPRSEVVVAGAGTGKTHALVNAYLFALLGFDGGGEERSPARVLAITFTDKAASEMRRRVALRLQALARDPRGDDDVNARAAALGRKVPETRVLEKMSRQLPGAPIGTFHGLCSLLLRDHALNAGIDPGFTLLDPVAELELLLETAEAVVLDRLAAGDANVAELGARFSLKRLGAGAGLVDALVAVQQKLAERGVEPEDVTPSVFVEDKGLRVGGLRASADDAVKALWEAVRGADDVSQRSLKNVFRAYRRMRELLDRWDPDDEHDLATQFLAVRDGLERGRLRGQALSFARDTALAVVKDLGVALCDRVTAPHAAAVRSLVIDLEERVRREKDQLGVLGFGDMLLRTRDLLRDDPSVRARVKARFDRVLVDEYQDTSPVQEDLVALLAEEVSRGDRVPVGERAMGTLRLEPGRLFVVGDPKQSIYGFRGADVTVFQHTLDVVVEGTERSPASGERRPLSVSWRSRPPILALVNQVALQTLPSGGVGVDVQPEDLLTPKRSRGAGEGEGKAGALWVPIDVGDLEPEQAEGIVVARKVRALLDEGLVIADGDEERPCRAGDIAILIRRVKAAAPIVRALAHQGVPALLTGGEGFFQRPEVMDLIAALQLIVEPEDDLATLTVLRSPLLLVPDDAIVQITEGIDGWRRGLRWREVPEAAERAGVDASVRARIEELDRLLSSLRAQLHHLPAARMVDALVDEAGYALALGVERDAADRLANVEKLRALCEGRPGDALRTIHRLWAWLDDPPKESIASMADPDVDAVRIMTMHQAKGLEFPIVVVADAGSALPGGGGDLEIDFEVGLAVSHRGRPIDACSWKTRGLLVPPAIERVRQRRRAREEAELARLLYVALTRARDFVFVIGEERENKGISLRRLLERGRMADPRAFAALLPSEKVPARLGPSRPLPVTRVPDVAAASAAPVIGPVRLVPSALAEPLPAQVDALIAGGQVIEGNVSARRRGRFGHRLIGRLGELLAAGALPDVAAVERAAVAAARSLGEEVDAPDTRALLKRVVSTVHGPLRRLTDAGCTLTFEEPVRTPLGARAVLVGSADLVARGPRFTAVIELKSSRRGLDDPATGVQLAAYARALEDADEGVVLVAAWVIGDEEPAAPARIDEEAEGRLEELLSAAAD